jgi:hypothetical protein
MGLRFTHGKNEQRLIGVGEDHLLDIFRPSREASKHACPWLNRLNLAFPGADVSDPHSITHGDQIRSPPLPFQGPFNGGDQHARLIPQLDPEKQPMCLHDDGGSR